MSDRKIALVTGANKGIGFEIARQLGGRGFIVALAARDAAKVGKAASRLGGQRIDAHGVALDVTDPPDGRGCRPPGGVAIRPA